MFIRKNIASVEDIEYFECQQEMSEEIQKQCQQVERIVGEFLFDVLKIRML